MAEVNVIRHKVFVEGVSQRQVATQMSVSRNTVRKYLTVSEPKRIEKNPRVSPVHEKVAPRIEELLEEWKHCVSKKQRITATRLHEQLIADGFQVSSSWVRKYYSSRRLKASEVFIPLQHYAGDEAQIDFFEVTVNIANNTSKAWMFVMHLMYSGRDFACIYEHCDQISFLDGHVRAFAHFGGVPQRCIYDNLKSAVTRICLPKRFLSPRFQALASHYLFEPCFARVGVGHDKGGVECTGKAIRLRYLSPYPCGQSLAEINATLLAKIDANQIRKRHGSDKTITELFVEEKSKMLPLPSNNFEARQLIIKSVRNKHCRLRVSGSWYSVPMHWRARQVNVYLGVDNIEFVCGDEHVTHTRQKAGESSIKYMHFLPELAKKPQAVRQVAPALLKELGEPFGEFWQRCIDAHEPKDAARIFAGVLSVIVKHGQQNIAAIISQALKKERIDLLALSKPTAAIIEIEVPKHLSSYEIQTARAADFDHLIFNQELNYE